MKVKYCSLVGGEACPHQWLLVQSFFVFVCLVKYMSHNY